MLEDYCTHAYDPSMLPSLLPPFWGPLLPRSTNLNLNLNISSRPLAGRLNSVGEFLNIHIHHHHHHQKGKRGVDAGTRPFWFSRLLIVFRLFQLWLSTPFSFLSDFVFHILFKDLGILAAAAAATGVLRGAWRHYTKYHTTTTTTTHCTNGTTTITQRTYPETFIPISRCCTNPLLSRGRGAPFCNDHYTITKIPPPSKKTTSCFLVFFFRYPSHLHTL